MKKLPLHIQLISEELRRRKEKNRRYSMRAFARFLCLHPSALSRLLAGKQEISLQSCAVVLKKLSLSPVQTRLFIASVAEDKMNRASRLLAQAVDPTYFSGDYVMGDQKIIDPRKHERLGPDAVLRLTPDLVTVLDSEGRFLFVNESFARAMGTFPCDLIGKTGFDLEISQKAKETLQKKLSETQESHRETRFKVSFDGEKHKRAFEVRFTPVLSENKSFHAILATYQESLPA